MTSPPNPSSPHQPPVGPVLLTAFLDMVGIGLIFPVVAPLIVRDTGHMLVGWTEAERKLLYGLLISCYPIAQLLGAPLLGALSDRHGRKPVIMVALLGGALAYLAFAIGVEAKILWLIFAARALAGFFSGNISIVYSAMAELSTPEARARNFGMIGMMSGLGFILGPALGGFLTHPDLGPGFGPATPFFVSAAFCLLNLALVKWRMVETLRQRSHAPMDVWTGVRNISKAFRMEGMTALFGVVLLSTLGFAFFTQFFNVYMIQVFDYTDVDLAWIFSYIGLCIAVVQGGLMRPLTRIFRPEQILRLTYLGLAIALALVVLPSEAWMIYVLIPLVAVMHGLSFPNLSSLVSVRAPSGQQGEIMGINQSLGALGNAVPPVLAGFLSGIDVRLPLLAASGSTLLAWAVFVVVFKGRSK